METCNMNNLYCLLVYLVSFNYLAIYDFLDASIFTSFHFVTKSWEIEGSS